MTTLTSRRHTTTTRRLHESQAFTHTEPRSLEQAVEKAARALDENMLTPVAPVEAGLAFQPRTLVAVLAYSYARQIYRSADIEKSLRCDANFRLLGCGATPDARSLRRVRRENREALMVCLRDALLFVAEQKLAQGFVAKINRINVLEEASRRIIMAMFTDSMEMDKDQTTDVPVDVCYLFANSSRREH